MGYGEVVTSGVNRHENLHDRSPHTYPGSDFFALPGPALLEVSARFKNGTTLKLRPSITPISLSFSI